MTDLSCRFLEVILLLVFKTAIEQTREQMLSLYFELCYPRKFHSSIISICVSVKQKQHTF